MIQIRLLGQFDIRLDGKRVTIPSRAGQSLLAYLVLTAGTPHRREKLAGTFWPDTTDETARKNLRQELWRIRKAISTQQHVEGDYLLADEFTLAFNREAEFWLDVFQMERPDLDLQSLIANLSLYQGELLPGFYDEWITLERERVQAVFEARMEQLLEQLITAEHWIAVQEWGERWLSLSGVREPAYRALMLASGVRGDMAKVASLYQRCTDELLEYVGIEPSAETRALYDGLLKGAKIPLRTSAAQPSGTITFLFTDIEGSTRLLEKIGDQYAVALGEHHEILRAAVQKWNGREVDTQGDAFFVTFTRALDAVQCAAEAQRALAAHPWHQSENLRVRMGLHTGEPLIASTGYVGMDVHRAARIGDAGHGGQILLSQTTRELVIHDLPEGMAIRDLGEHRLKDMKYPSSIYQLVINGLSDEFAPIRTKFSGAEAPTPGEAPFKGLEFFDVEDSELFFGRETLTAKLLDRLQDAKFLSVIIGASGSGKSSLVRAGLVPAIKKGGTLVNETKPLRRSANWQVHIITPTAHPLEALAIELTRDSESVTAVATLVDDLSKDPRSLHFFLSRRAQTSDTSHTLLVIDQFEELFTLCRDEFEREAFIDNLLTALTPPPFPLSDERKGESNITLIITLRADFYAHLAQYPELRDAVAQQQEYIGPMTTEELRRAIEEPARRGHWEFEPGLVDLILRDVGDEPGALPLLSHALLETWKRRAGHRLTLKGYADAGGVHGAIAHTAESVYQNLSLSEQTIVRNILLRLTEFGEGTEDTRRRASFDELMSHAEAADDVRAVLNILAEARLITLSEDTAEVAHEALIREWPKLREWLSQDREGIILHRQLTDAAHEWELLERDAGSVYRGARLAQANEWSALNPTALNAQERLFLDASNRLAKQEEQERENQLQRELASAKELAETQRQSASRLRIRNRVITTVGIIAIILAMLAGTFGLQSNRNAITAQNEANARATAEANAVNESKKAQHEALVASVRELAGNANLNLETDPERSILLALQAVKLTGDAGLPPLLEVQDALHRAVQTSRVQLTLHGHTSEIMGLAYSLDGLRLATISDDGTVRVWEIATGKELLTIPITITIINLQRNLSFSLDGKRLAAGDGQVAKVWDAASGKELLTLSGHTAEVIAVVFSPDGMRIATGSADGVTKIWDAVLGKELLALTGAIKPGPSTANLNALAFSPDGTRIATASNDYIVKIWDVTSGQELLSMPHTNPVGSITFSPDGTSLATGVYNANWMLWDASTGQSLVTGFGHASLVTGVSFDPSGKRLATASADGTAKIWDAATGRELLTLSGHTSGLLGAAFNPDGRLLATASRDATVKVWDVSPHGGSEWFNLTSHTNRVWGLAYSPDGTRVATGSFDKTVKIWNAITGDELFTLSGFTLGATNLAFSPNGTRLLVGNGRENEFDATVWDLATRTERLTLQHEAPVSGVAYIPDGKYIATSSQGEARIWDAETGNLLNSLKGHTANIGMLTFSLNGTRLATASEDGTARVWNVATGEMLFILSNHTGAVQSVAFSPDGSLVATASNDGTAKVWEVATGQELFTLAGHTGPVYGIAFSPTDQRLATSSVDRTVKIWDVSAGAGAQPLTLYGHTAAVYRVAFSPDGTRLVTTSRDGTARLYALNIEDLVAIAKSRLTRGLTTEECQKYLHTQECPSTP